MERGPEKDIQALFGNWQNTRSKQPSMNLEIRYKQGWGDGDKCNSASATHVLPSKLDYFGPSINCM